MSSRRTELIPAHAAPLFAALGDATRLSLLSQLKDGQSYSIAQLTAGRGLTRQGISKHLAVLEDVGMVSREHVGRESRYRFRYSGVANAKGHLDRAAQQWDEALTRLKIFLGEQD